MKDSRVDRPGERKLVIPMDGEKGGSERFGTQGKKYNALDETQYIRPRRRCEKVLHDHTLAEGNAFSDPSKENYGDGHDAQPADLNEGQDHALPKPCKESVRIHDAQPRNTHGGGGRKQSIDKGDGSALGGDREHQQQGSRSDGQKEAGQHEDGRMGLENSVAQCHDLNLGFWK